MIKHIFPLLFAYISVKMFRGVFVEKIKERGFSIVTGLLMVACLIFIAQKGSSVMTAGQQIAKDNEQICIVLDAGHGGDDPGKIGINGSKEKDINLIITQKVKRYLEANDIKVIMTRSDENGLYDPGAENKKVQDMKRRIAIMEKASPVATISIHQNSYPEEYVNGAQVFYHKDSKAGQQLASLLQEILRSNLNPENHRQIKANDSYYLLKKTQIPTVIVECGFLSNSKEAALLSDETYQDKVAWAIHLGIMQFINTL